MPELPEVETIRRSLHSQIIGCKIESVRVLCSDILENATAAALQRDLEGGSITEIARKGKYLIFECDGKRPAKLVIHLGMTGQLLLKSKQGEFPKHVHLSLELASTSGEKTSYLWFRDVRRFGGCYLLRGENVQDCEEAPRSLRDLGPDPLQIDREMFCSLFEDRRGMIKPLLLDQTFLAGLGNIYVDECLHMAGIHPCETADVLKEEELGRLHAAIRHVLQEALRFRGTTFSDYVDGRGRNGSYGERLRVYGKEQQPCPVCGGEIQKTKVAGRGTHFCPHCQAPPPASG